jgi:phage terminase large subunit
MAVMRGTMTADSAGVSELIRRLSEIEPQPKQKEFMLARERYVLYGGARGGGKSWALQIKLTLMCLKYPGLQCLLLRRSLPELEYNHMAPLMKLYGSSVKTLVSKKRFEFVNGSVLRLGYCMNDGDALQFQGQNIDVVAIDEATQFKESWIQDILAANRTIRTDMKPQAFFTANPGGVSHAWFKRLFVDRDYRSGEDPGDYRFVSARVYDNAVLMTTDPEYVKVLENLPEARRKAWLDGDWDVFEGQAFAEWRNDPAGYFSGQGSHVLDCNW